MRNITIAIDGTEHSLDPLALGRLLGRTTGAPLAVVHVYAEDSPAARGAAAIATAELARLAGVEPGIELIPGGRRARELQLISERAETGVVVIGSTSRGAVGRLLLGSVGEALLAGAACPVAIAPHGYVEQANRTIGVVGVAYDGSEDARHALGAARQLARSAGAGLRVLTVFGRVAFGGTTTVGAFGHGSVNNVLRADLHSALEDALGEPVDGVEPEGRFLEGSPADVLAEQSRELDLLVMGSRGFGPRGAVLLGSTTHAVTRNAQCPVLITPRGTDLELGDRSERRPAVAAA